jgi:exopolysaccharide biosynthesis polyprenyl glycosylphosphotransferase
MRSKVMMDNQSQMYFGDMIASGFVYPALKRSFEFLFSLLLLVSTLPVLLIIAIAIKLESPGSIFYKQERVGKNGKLFNVWKLRSMRNDAEKHGPQWAAKNDARVTQVGNFIRKTRIDELPQLFNVLGGEMSLIGPRPERPMFTEQFDKEIPGFKNRLLVKPGLTGWAQVNGGYEMTPAEKLELDMFYIQKQSFFLDTRIFFRTIMVVFTGDGAR